jgi:hypothetical protein
MMLMLASTFYISPEGWLVLAFVFVVLPVSLISLIANWLIRPWWVASLFGPLVCLVVMVCVEHQRTLSPVPTNSDGYSHTAEKYDDKFVMAVTAVVLLSVLPSFGIGAAFAHARRKRKNTSGAITFRSPSNPPT